MESKSTYSGIGFTGVLTIVFITLKLLKIISWSWWWVLAPLWIDIGLAVVIILIWMIVRVFSASFEEKINR